MKIGDVIKVLSTDQVATITNIKGNFVIVKFYNGKDVIIKDGIIEDFEPTAHDIKDAIFANDYDMFLYLYNKNPIDLDTACYLDEYEKRNEFVKRWMYSGITIVDDKIKICKFMLEKGVVPYLEVPSSPQDWSSFIYSYWEEPDIKYDDIIYLSVRNGGDPFTYQNKLFDAIKTTNNIDLMLRLLEFEDIRTWNKLQYYLTDDMKEQFRKDILEQARVLLDTFPYTVVQQILENAFYIGAMDYKQTNTSIYKMAVSMQKIHN